MTGHVHAAGADPLGWVVPLVLGTGVLVLYVRGAGGVRARTGRPWPRRTTWSFAGGVAAVVLALAPAGGALAGGGARGHMLQHVLLGMVAPVGLVLAAPVTLVLASLPVGRRRRAVRALASRPVQVLAHPVTAGLLHVGGLYALYGTPLYALTLRSATVHHLVLAHFLAAGCLFTWSLVGPERASRRPGVGTRVVVLVAASAAHGYGAKLLYARAPALPPGSPHGAADLQSAAQLMYYAGDVVEVVLAVVLLGGAYRRARRRAGLLGAAPSTPTEPALPPSGGRIGA